MTNKRIRTKVTALTLGYCLLFGSLTLAQTNIDSDPGWEFNFSLPGARSLALGGTFLARPDDATAAYANPAGLTNLTTQEFSVEIRSWSYTKVFTSHGRAGTFEPTRTGIDQISGLRTSQAKSDARGLAFLSFVYPATKRLHLALYRHELANYEADFEYAGNFLNHPRSRNRPTQSVSDLYIVGYGTSLGVALGEPYDPHTSLGIGISFYEFSIDSLTRRYAIDRFSETTDLTRLGDVYGPPLFSNENILSRQFLTGADTDWAINIGFVHKITRRLDIGGAYRQGPDFNLRAIQLTGPAEEDNFSLHPTNQIAVFHVPDTYGIGLSFAATESTRVMADYNHIAYSQMTEDMADIYQEKFNPELERFRVGDTYQLHLGFESLFFPKEKSRLLLALRLGIWLDPDHRIRYEGDCENREYKNAYDIRRLTCHRFDSLFQPGEDEVHYSAGFGIAEIPIGDKTKFQIDFAFDHSERIDIAAISAIFRFE